LNVRHVGKNILKTLIIRLSVAIGAQIIAKIVIGIWLELQDDIIEKGFTYVFQEYNRTIVTQTLLANKEKK